MHVENLAPGQDTPPGQVDAASPRCGAAARPQAGPPGPTGDPTPEGPAAAGAHGESAGAVSALASCSHPGGADVDMGEPGKKHHEAGAAMGAAAEEEPQATLTGAACEAADAGSHDAGAAAPPAHVRLPEDSSQV